MRWFQNVMVGLLFFGALILVGYFTIFSEGSPFARRGMQLVIYFNTADGIKEGSRVSILGVPSGKVQNVELVAVNSKNERVPNDSPLRVRQKVAITVEINNPLVFYENHHIAIKNESVLAGKIIAIDPGSAYKEQNEEEFSKITVFAMPANEIADLNSSALEEETKRRSEYLAGDETAAFVELHGETSYDPIASVAQLIEDNRENVRKTIGNLAGIAEKINNGHGSLGRLLNDTRLHRNTNTMFKDGEVVVKELRESLEDTREQAPVTSFIQALLTAF